jgi:hypothetical protein
VDVLLPVEVDVLLPVEVDAPVPVAVDVELVEVVPLSVWITSAGVSPATIAPTQKSARKTPTIAPLRVHDEPRYRLFRHMRATCPLSLRLD